MAGKGTVAQVKVVLGAEAPRGLGVSSGVSSGLLTVFCLLVLLAACSRHAPPVAPPADEDELAGLASRVVSFTLVDADTGQPLAGYDSLPDGAVLDVAALPTRRLDIRANTNPQPVGSVRFSLNSAHRTQNEAPYLLTGRRAGGGGGDFPFWSPIPGDYRLTATPYTGPDAVGTAGTALTIAFRISAPVPKPAFSHLAWTNLSASPRGVTEAQGAVVDGRLFVFGGYTSWTPFCTTTEARAYDPASDTWTKLAPMPEPWTHGSAAVDGKSIYVAGGYLNAPNCDRTEVATTTVYRYDVDGDSWHDDLPPLPQPRASGALVRLGRTLHFFGGTNSQRVDKGDHWVLSLDGPGRWVAAAPLPNPRSHMGATVYGGKIYAIGGQHRYGEKAVMQRAVHVYDPASDRWSELAPLPAPLSHTTASTFVMDGRIVVAGGERKHNLPVADVLAYDPDEDAWKPLSPLPAERRAGVAGVIGGKIVYSGGHNFSTHTFLGAPSE